MTLPKDLREMNEKQFKRIFEILRVETNDFKNFPPDILMEDSKIILIIRCCLGLSQTKFADLLGTTKDWVRHTESGRRKILNVKPAMRWAPKIEMIIRNSEITFEKALECWRRFKFARDQKLPEIEDKRKTIKELTEEEFKEWFECIKAKTDNFTTFNPNILVENPQNILIFRLILGISHRRVSKVLGLESRWIRKWEHLEMRIKPLTAKKVMLKIKDLFELNKPDVSFEKVKENFLISKGIFGHRNVKSWIENGLKFSRIHGFTKFEKRIQNILKSANAKKFECHATVEGIKNKFCVDFVIGNASNPDAIIEVFTFSSNKAGFHNCNTKAKILDHRFQMIKLKHPKVKTIMCVEFNGKPILSKLRREMLESQVINTDFLLINEEISKLPNIIESI
jgi:DNA-binding transcriptional regulator YiaG